MTQEIILGVLLIGIIGLIWALTFSILGDDQPAQDDHEDTAGHQSSSPERPDETPLPQRTIAA